MKKHTDRFGVSHNWFAAVLAAILLAQPALLSGEETKELRMAHFPNITHAQALLARAGGDYEKKIGVPVRWVTLNAGPPVIEALFTGAIDAAYVGPSPVINGFLKSKGSVFKVVAGSASGGAALVLRGDVKVSTEADFHGKTIATPQLGNTQDVAARSWFAGRGFRFKDKGGSLNILPLSNPDQLMMFQKKQIDGAWTVEPWVSRLELEGAGKIYLEEKTLWENGRYPTTCLVVSQAFLRKHPQWVRNLIEAHIDLTKRLETNKADCIAMLGEELKRETGKDMGQELLRRAAGRVEFTWDPMLDALKKSANDAHALGFLKEIPNLDGLADLTLLESILKEKGWPPAQKSGSGTN